MKSIILQKTISTYLTTLSVESGLEVLKLKFNQAAQVVPLNTVIYAIDIHTLSRNWMHTICLHWPINPLLNTQKCILHYLRRVCLTFRQNGFVNNFLINIYWLDGVEEWGAMVSVLCVFIFCYASLEN